MVKGKRVNSPSQKGRGGVEGTEVQQGCRSRCGFEHVSSAESFRNLLAPSPSREHAIKKSMKKSFLRRFVRTGPFRRGLAGV